MPARSSAARTAATISTSVIVCFLKSPAQFDPLTQLALDFFRRCPGVLHANAGARKLARIGEKPRPIQKFFDNGAPSCPFDLLAINRVNKFLRRFHAA